LIAPQSALARADKSLANANKTLDERLPISASGGGIAADSAETGEFFMKKDQNIIAIVDDDPDLRDALDLLLSAQGYRTELFSSAEQFMSAAMTTRSACVVVDIQLGDLSGVEMARHLCAMGYDFPLIFMSGSHDAVLHKQALDLGCIAFLHKPFPMEQLFESIAKATNRGTRH